MKSDWLQIRIEPQLKEQVEQSAKEMGLSMSGLIRLAVLRFIKDWKHDA